MTGSPVSSLARPFRRAALPLAAYYAVTLVLPLANGAARADTLFVRHGLVVLLVPAAIVVLMSAARILLQRARVFVVTRRTPPRAAGTKDTKNTKNTKNEFSESYPEPLASGSALHLM